MAKRYGPAMFCGMLMAAIAGAASADDASTIPPREAVIQSLPGLHLLEPWWSSAVIYGDSTLPMQLDKNGPITGRLAFPAAEILAVKDANGTNVRTRQGRLSGRRRPDAGLRARVEGPVPDQ